MTGGINLPCSNTPISSYRGSISHINPYYTIKSSWIPNNERHLALKVTGIDWSSSTGTGPFHLFLSQITHLFQSLTIRTIMNYPQIPTYQPRIKSHQAIFSRWSAEASCYSQLVFFSSSTGTSRKPHTAGRCKHAAAAVCLLQNLPAARHFSEAPHRWDVANMLQLPLSCSRIAHRWSYTLIVCTHDVVVLQRR